MYVIRDKLKYRAKVRTKSQSENTGFTDGLRNDKNKIYSATELVFITTVSVLCGSDTWNEIHYFCERNFDYFKRRLPDLKKDIEFWLSEDERLNFRYGRRYTTEETGHGRHEFRECVVADFTKEASLFFKEWKGLRTLAKVTATRTVAGHEPTTETRYYNGSWAPLSMCRRMLYWR